MTNIDCDICGWYHATGPCPPDATHPTTELDALRARVAELEAALRGGVQHAYEGDCPDSTQPESRDPNCPGCRLLLSLNL